MKKNSRGFTLVEILVVVAIIGILAVVAVPSLFKNIEKGKIADIEYQYSAIKSAVLSYYGDNSSIYDIDKDDLTQYLETKIPDYSENTPIGGFYQIYSRKYLEGNSDGSLKGMLVKIDSGNIKYEKQTTLKNKGEVFLGIRNVRINDNKLFKLVKDIGEGNVYVYDDDQTYAGNIIFLKLI